MTSRGTGATRSRSAVAGSVSWAPGVLTAAVAYTYLLSPSDTLDPPTRARNVGLEWLPLGLGGALIGLVGLAAFVALVIAIG